MKNNSKVIILAGVYDQIALINEFKNKNYYTILIDYYSNPPAKDYAVIHYQVSTLDIDEIKKIAIKEEGKAEAPIIVKKHHLDTNNHVNNGQYVRMAMDFIPYDFEVSQMRAEYKKSALLGDIILPKVYKENDIYTIGLWDETDNLYASVELK